MKLPKKIGLVLVLGAVVTIGIYQIGRSRINRQKTINASPKNQSAIKLSSFEPETNPLTKSQAVSSLLNAVEQPKKNNLTQSFAEILFEQIHAATVQQKDGATPDLKSISEELVNKFVNRSLPEISWIAEIDESRLKISANNSKSDKEDYLKTLSLLNQKNFDGFEKNYLEVVVDVYQKINTDSAKQLANIYQNAAKDYWEITVPSDWSGLHKKLIIYSQNAEMVYRTMTQYPSDPLKGYLALEALEGLTQSAEELQNIFQKEAAKNGL